MVRTITSGRVPVKLWLDDIEDGALKQACNLARLPFAFKWIAIMPDAHQGFGMPIGGVLAARDTVVPNAVGVDIGCGVCAVRTDCRELDRNGLQRILDRVRQRIPLGFAHHKKRQAWEGWDRAPDLPVIRQELDAAKYQLGTLGGGNHFIEVQHGSDGFIWLMLHSGSRNFGLKIAREYHRQAAAWCGKNGKQLPDKDLAWVPLKTREARDYLAAMQFALDFARANRFAMLRTVQEAVHDVLPGVSFGEPVDIHHNYAVREEHFGQQVMVHRKGATAAFAGQTGIIPGSQGTRSYIVTGRGNPESFMSCSHGAGRVLGRRQAQKQLNLAAERKRLEDAGIIHSLRSKRDLDEAAGAYKDIDRVMENQRDLVEIEVELRPLGVIKG